MAERDERPLYDVQAGRDLLRRVRYEADPTPFAPARKAAALALIRDLAAVDATATHVRLINNERVSVFDGRYEALITHAGNGRFIVHMEGDTRRPPEVPLEFEPVTEKLVGPAYEVMDPASGEKVTRHRDALVTVLEAAFDRIRAERRA